MRQSKSAMVRALLVATGLLGYSCSGNKDGGGQTAPSPTPSLKIDASMHATDAKKSIMGDFQKVRTLAERIISQRLFEPEQLESLFSTTFVAREQKLLNHTHLRAELGPTHVFTSCELRSPKNDRARSAILVCKARESTVKPADVYAAYGTRGVESTIPSPHSSATMPSYLSIASAKERLSYGFHKESKTLISVVFKFEL